MGKGLVKKLLQEDTGTFNKHIKDVQHYQSPQECKSKPQMRYHFTTHYDSYSKKKNN